MCLNWGNLSECERFVHVGWCEYTAAEEEALFSGMFIGHNTQTGQLDTGAEHPKFMPFSVHGQYFNAPCKQLECEDKTQPVCSSEPVAQAPPGERWEMQLRPINPVEQMFGGPSLRFAVCRVIGVSWLQSARLGR